MCVLYIYGAFTYLCLFQDAVACVAVFLQHQVSNSLSCHAMGCDMAHKTVSRWDPSHWNHPEITAGFWCMFI